MWTLGATGAMITLVSGSDSATREWGTLTGGGLLVAGLMVMLAGQFAGGRRDGRRTA